MFTGTQVGYLGFQWSKWARKKNLRKNLVFWPTFVFWSIWSDTLVPWSPWSPGTQVHRRVISASSGRNELGKKSKKKPSVLTNFCFLVNFIRHTGPMVTMVTRCTGSLSQLPVVKISWVKKIKKNNCSDQLLFHFIGHIGPMVTTSQQLHKQFISVVEISWGKKFKKKT